MAVIFRLAVTCFYIILFLNLSPYIYRPATLVLHLVLAGFGLAFSFAVPLFGKWSIHHDYLIWVVLGCLLMVFFAPKVIAAFFSPSPRTRTQLIRAMRVIAGFIVIIQIIWLVINK